MKVGQDTMIKSDRLELWQLKMGLLAVIAQLNEGPDHIDKLTSRTIARVLGELMQETTNLPRRASVDEIEAMVADILVGTGEMQQQLAERWRDELAVMINRVTERTTRLQHDLAEFTCLSVDGQRWGAVCMKCLDWVYVEPDGSSGAVLYECRGWIE